MPKCFLHTKSDFNKIHPKVHFNVSDQVKRDPWSRAVIDHRRQTWGLEYSSDSLLWTHVSGFRPVCLLSLRCQMLHWCVLPYGTTRLSKQRGGWITTVSGETSLWVIIMESRLTVRQLSHIHNSLHLSGPSVPHCLHRFLTPLAGGNP